MHPDDRDSVIVAEERSRDAGHGLTSEYRMIAADGRVVWIRDEAETIATEIHL